ncbi:MAG TPA: amidohydrolase family protein [Mycobacteriales bacterium]|nr:amidohydrolase family protein [Mycobacteriales bacterium]
MGTDIHRITGIRLASEVVCDVRLVDGVITELRLADPAITGATAADHLHLPGWLLLPSGVEPHAHVDKAFSWSQVDQVYGDLGAAIDSWHGYSGEMTEADVYARARRAFDCYLRHGITAVRTHVDLLPGPDPMRGITAVLGLRDELRDVMDIQVALLASAGNPTPQLIDALHLGVDVVGGCPHLTPDPAAEVVRLLDLADRLNLPVDLHTDEQLGADVLSIEPFLREVDRRGLGGRAAASHCVSLGSLSPAEIAALAAEIHRVGLGIITLPITNLYLQARAEPVRTPRGLPALRALLDAGVTVAAGGDNVRDPFNPMGRADPFETTSLLITAGHLDADQALHAVTAGARRILRLPPAGTVIGQRADLMAVRAPTLADALAGPGDDRIVLYRGRLVSRTTVTNDSAVGAPAPATVQ